MGISWEFRNYGTLKMDYTMRLFMDIYGYIYEKFVGISLE
jgi:hypothetical protein